MLSIERELARVRADIESMDAQIKQMERQAAQATLTVELVEPTRIVRPTNGIDWGFREALSSGIQGGVELLKWMVTAILALAPLWLMAIALFFLIRWRVRVRRARRAAAAEQATPAVEQTPQA
jgi:Flp pilus assembly protein TadB